jgi:hypothetical protein
VLSGRGAAAHPLRSPRPRRCPHQATEGLPVKDLPIHVEVALEVGEDHKDDHPDDPRTEHQLGAIHLYTQGWAVVADSLYAVSRRCEQRLRRPPPPENNNDLSS